MNENMLMVCASISLVLSIVTACAECVYLISICESGHIVTVEFN